MTNPRQVRRPARKLRRPGIEPAIFIGGSGDGSPTTEILLLRLLWRYRSELIPLVVASALFFLGWRLHSSGAHWQMVAAATMPAVGMVWLLGGYTGLTSWLERAYAVAVLLAA